MVLKPDQGKECSCDLNTDFKSPVQSHLNHCFLHSVPSIGAAPNFFSSAGDRQLRREKMLRPVNGAVTEAGLTSPCPHFLHREFSHPPLAGHKGYWDEGLVKAKGGKHSAHSFSCFDLKYSCSKGLS